MILLLNYILKRHVFCYPFLYQDSGIYCYFNSAFATWKQFERWLLLQVMADSFCWLLLLTFLWTWWGFNIIGGDWEDLSRAETFGNHVPCLDLHWGKEMPERWWQGSFNLPVLLGGGIEQYTCMVRDFPYNYVLFGLVIMAPGWLEDDCFLFWDCISSGVRSLDLGSWGLYMSMFLEITWLLI